MRKKEKATYSLRSNIRFVFGKLALYDKALIVFMLLQVPIAVLIPLLDMLLPREIVSLLSGGSNIERIVITIGAFTAALMILRGAKSWLGNLLYWRNMLFDTFVSQETERKTMMTDYRNIESPKGQTMRQKAAATTYNGNNSPFFQFPRQLFSIVTDVICLVVFGLILSSATPLMFIVLFVGAAAQYGISFFPRNYRKKHEDEAARLYNQLNYLGNKGADFSSAKDVRVYKIASWFDKLFGNIAAQRMVWERRFAKRYFAEGVVNAMLRMMIDGLVFAWLGYSVYGGTTSAADAILYFYAIQAFGGRLTDITYSLSDLMNQSLQIGYLREFVDMPDTANRGEGPALPDRVAIKLENVSFTYPESEDKVLDGFNLEIRAGEKLAVVGRNGAGKTTAVKLICGFYQPTEGHVRINDTDAAAYNYEDYFKLFSAVFQDIKLMPTPLAENVSSTDAANTDYDKVRKCLAQAGILERAETLPLGLNTPLVKGITKISAEMSGGETQRLMLARALYKDAPVIILDEPTAALDPIAESELYQKYNELTKDKTSIFISHRLASTHFCDKIAFIDEGRVAEYGTHDELVAAGGKYAEMFAIQSHYYRKELKKKELETEGIL